MRFAGLLLFALAAHAQVIEWVGIVVDPPGSSPTRIIRQITVQKGVPTIVEPYVPPPPVQTFPGHFEAVQGVAMDGTWWCLSPTPGAVVVGLAIGIGDLTYTFNSQLDVGQPTPHGSCGSAIDVRAVKLANNPDFKIGSLGAMLYFKATP